jgi:hypothetical protein
MPDINVLSAASPDPTGMLDVPGAPDPPRSGRGRSRGTWHRVILTAHILTATGWFGAALVVAVLAGAAGASDDAAAHVLYRAVGTAIWVTAPLGAAAVVTGIILGLTTPWGVVRYRWVVAKELLAVAVIATDLALLGPNAGDALHGHLDGPLLDPAIAHCVVLAVATVLSVFKPGGRTALGRRRVASRA